MCRKVTGSAYGVFAHIRSDRFRWTSSVDSIVAYESSTGHVRAFCHTCGSSVPNVKTEFACIPAGAFDSDPGVRPMLQIFAGSKATWYAIAQDPVAYEEFDPD